MQPMGIHALPDMYALSLQAYVHVRQITRAHAATITCTLTTYMITNINATCMTKI